MKSPYSMLPESIGQHSRRTKVLAALCLLSTVVLLLGVPYGPCISGNVQRIFNSQHGQDGLSSETNTMPHESSSSSSSVNTPEDCVEVGTWKTLSSTSNRHIAPTSAYPLAAETSFELPLDSDLLYFLSHGSNQEGTVWIDDTCARGSDKVTVDVQMYYNTQDALDLSKACRLQKSRSSKGVGVFTPLHSDSNLRLYFAIKIRLPPADGGARVSINALDTNFPNYRHDIGDLARNFDFGRLSLRGSNGMITIKDVTAQQVNIVTTNGNIRGTVKSPLIDIQTSNGEIGGDFSVVDVGESQDGTLNMRTQNGRIASRISLLPEIQGGTGGAFKVTAKSSNDELELVILTAPLDSVLALDAQTSNAVATVSVPRTFEGTFRLQTSNGSVKVRHSEGVEDPAGAQRTRNVSWTRDRRGTTVNGLVAWEPQERRKTGSVSVKSSNDEVLLVVQ